MSTYLFILEILRASVFWLWIKSVNTPFTFLSNDTCIVHYTWQRKETVYLQRAARLHSAHHTENPAIRGRDFLPVLLLPQTSAGSAETAEPHW